MTDKPKRKISAPVLVVVAIALTWVGMTLWPSRDQAPEPTPQESPATVASAPDTPPEPTVDIPITPENPDEPIDSNWSTYHGNPALTGVVQANLPDAPVVLWRFQADAPVYHTPVSCDGRIFFTTSRGGVFALDLEGNELWSKHLVREIKKDGTPRMERLDAPAACFDSTVLVGTMSGTLYAFNAATGDERWTYYIGGPVLGTVNLHRSPDSTRLFVISQEDGSLHAIDLSDGRPIWKTESIDRCDGSPAVRGGVVVFGSCAAAIHIFSVEDGSLLSNIEFDGDSQVAGGVALVGESVFTGSHSGKLFHANLRTGQILWVNEDSEDEVLTTPAVHGDWVIFTSYDGRVYGLDRNTGAQKWQFDTYGWPLSPVIASDKVIVSADGTLYSLRLQTGEQIWAYEVSDEITSPAIVNERIIVGGEDGTITAFGAAKE